MKTLINKISIYEKSGKYPTISKGLKNRLFSELEEREIADDIKINYIDKHQPIDNEDLKIIALKNGTMLKELINFFG